MRIVSVEYQGRPRTAIVENTDQLRLVDFDGSTYELMKMAINSDSPLQVYLLERAGNTLIDYKQAMDLKRILVPIMHSDPAHCMVSGTGLTHLGSADARDAMHSQLSQDNLSDSMKMFKAGVDDGKPAVGKIGAEPEWFFKGDGDIVVPPNGDIVVPDFAEDAGEEPEIAGIYINNEQGEPIRIGFCVGNEFSDHIKERHNYLLLAHSKLRPCSIGPEILLGELPEHLEGLSQVVQNGKIIWQKQFFTGEQNMAHSIANLEHHHFKYANFRRAGDLHIHFFGTATLSFADGICVQDGDEFVIDIKAFGKPLKNKVVWKK